MLLAFWAWRCEHRSSVTPPPEHATEEPPRSPRAPLPAPPPSADSALSVRNFAGQRVVTIVHRDQTYFLIDDLAAIMGTSAQQITQICMRRGPSRSTCSTRSDHRARRGRPVRAILGRHLGRRTGQAHSHAAARRTEGLRPAGAVTPQLHRRPAFRLHRRFLPCAGPSLPSRPKAPAVHIAQRQRTQRSGLAGGLCTWAGGRLKAPGHGRPVDWRLPPGGRMAHPVCATWCAT